MIPMEMAYEDAADALEMNMKSSDLQLRAFRAVDQKQALIYVEQMSAWVSRQRWNCRITSEDRQGKGHPGLFFLRFFFV